jgi:hypothetical protein
MFPTLRIVSSFVGVGRMCRAKECLLNKKVVHRVLTKVVRAGSKLAIVGP